ncbi:MAG TPA: kelch repeat-containing protein, partial [Kofleriaceae bacterium]|nr:kelch repeat-containing protein [Kofleriaceae bacterium]
TDPATGAVVLVGGHDDSGAVLTDTWGYDGSWTLLEPSGPELADDRIAVFPPHRSVVVVTESGFTLEWIDVGWASAGFSSPQLPEPRVDHAAVLDPVHQRIVMFGGRTELGPFADTWMWDGRWVQAATARMTPPHRFDAALAYDAARDEVVLFGGTDLDRTELGDTWVFDGIAWTERVVAGPPGRHGHVMAYDPARAQVVLFGGEGFADTWTWNGTGWAERTVAGPPPTYGAAFAYDPPRRELVLFGGISGPGPTADTWTWNGAAWSKRTPAHLPPARSDAAMAYGAARRRLVMVGGAEVATLDDVWEWDGSEWTQLAIATGLTTRRGHTLVPSPDGDSLLVFGGEHRAEVGDQLLGDLVALRHGAAPTADRCARRDTDGDALAGCADPDCWQRCSPLCPHGVDPASFECTTGPRCGDGMCSPIESCGSCPGDCGACPEVCGDSVCSPGETCPGDCAP